MTRKGSPLSSRMGSRFAGRARKGGKKRLIVGVSLLFSLPYFASTLATNVGLGSGALEFGQGSRATIACDNEITTAITETWDNTSLRFEVSAITLSGIDTTSGTDAGNDGCLGKIISIGLLKSDGTVLDVNTDGTLSKFVATIADADGTFSVTGTSAGTATVASHGTSASITFPVATSTDISASDVSRITLESS